MTVHIAIAHGDHGVLFSDSQGTIENSEYHGLHKQFVGKNFAVGVAGYSPIITRLFGQLRSDFGLDREAEGADVAARVEKFYRDDVRPAYLERSAALLIGFREGDAVVREFEPGTFTTFGPPTDFGCIGTGAQFVSRAMARNAMLGNELPLSTLAEMLVSASHFADAAGESIAVDDALAVVMLDQSACYLLGDKRLNVKDAPEPVVQHWLEIAGYWTELQAMVKAMDREAIEAQRVFSKIRRGEFGEEESLRLLQSNRGLISTRKRLQSLLEVFQNRYSELVKGDPRPLPLGDPV